MTQISIPMRDAILNRIWLEMSSDTKIFLVSADFGSPVIDKIREDFPKRFINVGIAEQNLINISTGLALEGFKVFAYAIAPFITMRCFEQIRVNLALLSELRPMNVNLIGVGAGYSYVVSGPTHQCYEDITLMRALPNFQVLSPSDHVCAESLFERCITTTKPKYLRLDAQVLPVIYKFGKPNLDIGFHVHRDGSDICMISTGFMTHRAIELAETLSYLEDMSIGVIDIFDITNYSENYMCKLLSGYKAIVTMEEGFKGRGGIDSMMFDFIGRKNLGLPILNLGVNGGYRFELGTREELHELAGIGPKYIINAISHFIKSLQFK